MFIQLHSLRNKVLLALSICAMLFTTQSIAQKSVGLRAGISLNSFKATGEIDEDFDTASKLGYTTELVFNLPIGTSGLSIAPSAGFTYDQGSGYSTELGPGGQFPLTVFGIEKGTDTWNSIHLSSLFRYTFQGKSISPYFETGPLVTFNLGGNHMQEGQVLVLDQSTGSLSYANFEEEYEIEFGTSSSDVYKPSSFTWAIGTGVSADFEFGTLTFGIRYNAVGNFRGKESEGGPAGLKQQFLDQDGSVLSREYGSDDKLKLRTLAVQLGYSISIGGY